MVFRTNSSYAVIRAISTWSKGVLTQRVVPSTILNGAMSGIKCVHIIKIIFERLRIERMKPGVNCVHQDSTKRTRMDKLMHVHSQNPADDRIKLKTQLTE